MCSPRAQRRHGFSTLTIDYEERLYAAGKIPGGFIRREGRPSQEATLASRLTDRPIRPLLPKAWRREISDHHYRTVRRSGKRPRPAGHHRRFNRIDDVFRTLRRPGRRSARRDDQ